MAELERRGRVAATSSWLAVVAVSGGLFLAVLSTTVISVALPSIGRDLHATSSGLEWIVDAYVVTYASQLLTGGAIGDIFGRKGLFLLGLGVFAAGSATSAIAPSLAVLLTGRVIQGLGTAVLVPGSLTIVRSIFDDARVRAMAIGLWSTASGLALAVGPALGGLIVSGAGWRWALGFNIPIAAVLLVVVAAGVPRLERAAVRPRFDAPGAAASCCMIAALAFAVIEGQTRGWLSAPVVAALAAGAAAGIAFVLRERRLAHPLADVSLFSRPAFAAANFGAFAMFFAFVGAIVYLSSYFQQVHGYSPRSAGLAVAVIGVTYAVATVAAGQLVSRIGERLPLVAGLIIAGAAALGLLRAGVSTGIGALWWNLALLGLGTGLCGTPISTTAMSSVDVSRAGMASGIVNAVRQVGQVFGVAVLGALVYSRLPGTAGVRSLSPQGRLAFVVGLHRATWVSGLVLLGAAVVGAACLRPSRQARPARRLSQRRKDDDHDGDEQSAGSGVGHDDLLSGLEG